MLKEFLMWWSRQLLDLLPDRSHRRPWRAANAIVVEAGAAEPFVASMVRLIVRRRHHESNLGAYRLDQAGIGAIRALFRRRRLPRLVLVRLPAGTVPERQLVLPLAAERDPARVLSYEMDRITPFAADEVFWTWAIERRDPSRGRLTVRLSIAPKAAVQPMLDSLEQAGPAATRLEARPAPGPPRVFDLRREKSVQDRWLRRGVIAAATICAVLGITTAALPFVLQSAAGDAVERQVALLQPRVARAQALRRELAAKAAGGNVFAALRARTGDALQVLAAVTEILPDDTFLTALTLHGGKLELDGESRAPAHLIAALSADPMIRNPAFAAPVTRQDNRTEEFSITAEVAP